MIRFIFSIARKNNRSIKRIDKCFKYPGIFTSFMTFTLLHNLQAVCGDCAFCELDLSSLHTNREAQPIELVSGFPPLNPSMGQYLKPWTRPS
ncbi:hypothetical protein GJAV_G00200870 [Gymnothorax javanicus]|nr:hypothetical protein GJAV_G00200870 [Gymnothorax javanicus]